MKTTIEQQPEHPWISQGPSETDRNVVYELVRRQAAARLLDQYIVNAEPDSELKRFWNELKTQEEENVRRLRGFVTEHYNRLLVTLHGEVNSHRMAIEHAVNTLYQKTDNEQHRQSITH